MVVDRSSDFRNLPRPFIPRGELPPRGPVRTRLDRLPVLLLQHSRRCPTLLMGQQHGSRRLLLLRAKVAGRSQQHHACKDEGTNGCECQQSRPHRLALVGKEEERQHALG